MEVMDDDDDDDDDNDDDAEAYMAYFLRLTAYVLLCFTELCAVALLIWPRFDHSLVHYGKYAVRPGVDKVQEWGTLLPGNDK